ncbi:MAG: ATP-dependent Clp protease adaptor ClpS, partial [Chloroflexi bacterium]|nr:ATP-dependent Clp protease adaptor ClpS [Chloroflexota bacterium]
MLFPRSLPATATQPITRPDVEWETLRKLLPPYDVILHNDDVNDMAWVMKSLLVCVPDLSPEEAYAIMMQAHSYGEALVITCPLEHAELYRD